MRLITHDYFYKPPILYGLLLTFPIWDRCVTEKDHIGGPSPKSLEKLPL
jgi:hypothetical protein